MDCLLAILDDGGFGLGESGWRRCGIGRLLWSHALEWISHNHGPGIVTVNTSLNAISFYEKLGITIYGGVEERSEVIFQPMRRAIHPLLIESGRSSRSLLPL